MPGVGLFPVRTPTLLPATHTNSYVIGDRDLVLVEPATPYEDEQDALVEWAKSLETGGRKLVAMLATHHHPDHVGGAKRLAEVLGLPLWAHAETAARIEHPVARHLVDGESIVLEGAVPQRWDVLHTPGHAPGHVCLHERSIRTVIVGDMVASVGTILIAPGDGDMIAYLAQLGRLAQLDAACALPAHGDPIDDPSALFRRYIAHRLMREGAVLRALGPAPKPLEEILPIAYEGTPIALFPIALLSLRAHLEKLVIEGRVIEKDSQFALAAAA